MAKYRSYRGRSHRGVTILVVILVLLVLASVAIFFLPDFLVYTEDGVRLEFPLFNWNASPSATPLASPPASVTLEIVSPSPSPSPSLSPTPTPAPTTRGLFVAQALLGKPNQLQALKTLALSSGLDTLVLEIKNEKGVMAPDDEVLAAVEALSDPSLTLTACLSAFIDNTVTRSKVTYGVKYITGEVNWIDKSENRWINPYVPAARQYVIDCVLKAKQLGFTSVLLDHVHFPVTGSLDKISYGAQATGTHTEAMNLFLKELAEQADGIAVSAFALEDTLATGQNEVGGQDLQAFKETFAALAVSCADSVPVLAEPAVMVFPADSELLPEGLKTSKQGWLVRSADGDYPVGAFE